MSIIVNIDDINNKHSYTKALPYILFLFWPFVALILSLFNYEKPYAKNILWFACAFFGYTFIISNPEMDANRYRDLLTNLYQANYMPFFDLLLDPFTGKGIYSGTDIYSHLLTLIISRFTGDFRVLFALVGFVFGYFFSRNLLYILPFLKERRLILISLLIFVIIGFLIPPWNINGYRFYTACHVFVFGALRVIVERKYSYTLLCLLTPLIHFSMLFPILVLFIYLIFGNRYWTYTGGLVFSLLFSGFDTSIINQNAKLAPVFMQNKVSGYTTDEYVEFAKSIYTGMNWYVMGHIIFNFVCIYVLVSFVLLNRQRFMIDPIAKSLMSFGLLFLAGANIVLLVPSMGRFQAPALFILLIGIVYCLQNFAKSKWSDRLKVLILINVLFFITVEVRIAFDFIGLNTLFLNPLTAPYFPDSPALIEFFK